MLQPQSQSLSDNSPNKIPLPPGCELRCPGCEHRDFSAEASIEKKSRFLKSQLNLSPEKIAPVRFSTSEKRWNYRDKVCLKSFYLDGRWQFGFILKRRREIETVAIPNCPVQSIRANRVFSILSDALPPPDAFPMVYVSMTGALLTLVLKAPLEKVGLYSRFLSSTLQGALTEAGIEGLFLNFNPSAGNRVFASKGWRSIWGNPTANLNLGAPLNRQVTFGPECFLQLIPELYLDALSEAALFFKPAPGIKLIDLYSGIGISSRLWTDLGAEVLGVELGSQAIQMSRINCPSGNFLQGKAKDRLAQITDGELLFLNPPRTGVEPETLNWIGRTLHPRKVAYLSCSPGTLSRDLSALKHLGYAILKVIPYDFFPNTKQIESLALLDRVFQ